MKGDGLAARFRFTKRGRIRFISHRDVARAFERALRVAQAPLAFTQGFVPRPKVSFGLALPTGYESVAEYVDVALAEAVDPTDLVETMAPALPEGMSLTGATLLEVRAPSLQQAVTSTSYLVEVDSPDTVARVDARNVGEWVDEILQADRLEVSRRRKGEEVVEDVRPSLRAATVDTTADGDVMVDMELATQPRAVRPSEIIPALGPSGALRERRVLRIEQWIERDGSRRTPLEIDARVPTEVGA